jgi:predicted LPLAT superfamily acyltransferase
MAMYEAQAGPLNTFFSVTQAQDTPEIIPLGHLEAMLRIRDCLDAGKFVGIGSGGTGRASTGSPGSVRASRGAMIAFSTLAEPQTGQVTSARLACLS